MLGPVKLEEIKNLTPLPASIARLAQIVSDPDSTMDEFNEVVNYDQALTANVLRWANSSWSQSQMPVASLKTAVVRLGPANILKLAIGYHLMGPMTRASRGYALAENELWRHSVAAALAAENLANFTEVPIPATAFTAALMHDIGKLLLGRHLGVDAWKSLVLSIMETDHLTYLEAERKVMGTDHAQVGAAIAHEWNLPANLEMAIARHHNPDQEPDVIIDAVHIANIATKLLGIGIGIEKISLEAGSTAAERLGIGPQKIEALSALVKERLEENEALWKIK